MVMTLLTRPKKTVATVIVATDGSGDFNCDGTADEVEINAAMNSLPAGGGVVYMKEGTYNIDTSIVIPDDNVELIGAGASTRIETTQDIFMIVAGNVDRISVHLVYVYGSGAGMLGNIGIFFGFPGGVTLSSIDNCWAENCGAGGITLTGGSQNTVSNCKANTNQGDGINISDNYTNIINNQTNSNIFDGIFITVGTNNITVGNQANSNESDGIEVAGNDTVVIGNQVSLNEGRGVNISGGIHSTVSNNVSYSNLYGITLNSLYHIITGNQCYENTRDGIRFASANTDDCIISSNECINNDVDNTGTYSGIRVYQSDRNIISNNRCQGNDNYGIDITFPAIPSNDNVVEGNICIGNTAGPINDDGIRTQIAHNITT